MDAAEAEDAAKGAGDAASSLEERKAVYPGGDHKASDTAEKETTTVDTNQEDTAEDSQSQPVDMTAKAVARRESPGQGMTRASNTSSAVKRP